jgi:regulator of protease activity HflC (stomatin/prohibitin superfamily)
MYKEIKNIKLKDFDPKIISWQREDKGDLNTSLMYIYPQLGDNIKDKKFFAVKDYEKAIFYNRGALVDVLGGGIYEIDKKAKVKGTEIVWIDTSLIEMPWGVPQSSGIPTKDGIIIGLHGNLKLRINDVKKFYTNVVAGKKVWTGNDLKNWIIDLLHASLRDVFKKYTAKNVLLEERDRVVTLLTSKITDEFVSYGLDLETLYVIGIKSPEGMEQLYNLEKEKASVADELELLKVKGELDAQKMDMGSARKARERQEEILDATTNLEKTKLITEAKKVEGTVAMDLLESEEKARVAGDVKIIETAGDKEIKIAEIQGESEKNEKMKRNVIKQEIADLNEKLNSFDNLLAEGKISEDVYKMRISRIEKELKNLEKKLIE